MIFKRFLTLICLIFISLSNSFAQKPYHIEIQVKGLKDSTAYLAYYYGKGMYYRDTTQISSKGEMTFEGKDSLEHGMYAVINGNAKLIDIMVDHQSISIKTDTANIVENLSVKGSKETELFYEYLTFLSKKQKLAKKAKKLLSNGNEQEKLSADEALNQLDKDVKAYIQNFHNKNKGSFTSNFIYALDQPIIPDPPKNEDGSIDSTFAFRYYKAHYWDNYNFSDGRLLRTNTFNEKMNYYMDKLTVPDPDSIIVSADYILSRAKANKDLFKYALSQLTSKYERSENMGMDAVFVHLAKNYFMKGMAKEWFTEKQLEKLAERANALDPLLIGKKAPNIVVKDTAQDNFLELYKVKADFTIVYIWSPECGHCKTATPKLKLLYDKYKDKGVEVFAVGNEFENEEWKQFIIDHELNFINGSDGPTFQSNFRHTYDVFSTPQTYLLDKDKKILSKKMSIESLDKILEYFIQQKESDEK